MEFNEEKHCCWLSPRGRVYRCARAAHAVKALAIIQEKYLLLAQEQGLLDGMGDVAWGKDLTDCTSFLEQCRWISYKSKYAYNGSTEPVRWFGIKPPNKSQIEVMQQITPSYSDVMVIGPNLLYL